jgi:hypothetical protein
MRRVASETGEFCSNRDSQIASACPARSIAQNSWYEIEEKRKISAIR